MQCDRQGGILTRQAQQGECHGALVCSKCTTSTAWPPRFRGYKPQGVFSPPPGQVVAKRRRSALQAP